MKTVLRIIIIFILISIFAIMLTTTNKSDCQLPQTLGVIENIK